MSVAIHKIVHTADGKTFAIGEQFKKSVNGTAVAFTAASVLLGGGGSNVSLIKVELHDMRVFEFNQSFKVTKASVFQKDQTNCDLPSGAGWLGNGMLAYLPRQWGRFDYEFTTISHDKKTFTSAYVNYDKDKEEGNSYLIGDIAYTKEGKLAFDKIKLTDKPTNFRALPAKPGYMAVFKYFKKEKKIDLSLEKMNF
jgi:hypothetical protein